MHDVFTHSTFGRFFVFLDHYAAANRTRLRQRSLPIRPVTIRIIAASVEKAATLRPFFDQITATLRAGHAYFHQDLLSVAAVGIVAATDEPPIPAFAVDQRVPALRAITAD